MRQVYFTTRRPQWAAAPMSGRALSASRQGAPRPEMLRQVTCMAHPRRVVKVAKQIEREIGQLLVYDKVMQQAICPERRSGFDSTLSAVASVTEVQLTNDLQVAKVYISVYSDDVGKAVAMQSLQRLEGYVRKHIGRTVRLRLTPEIRFIMDDSIDRIDRVEKLLKQMEQIRLGAAEPPPIAIWEDEEEGEGDYSDDEDDSPGSAAGTDIGSVDLGFFGGGGSGPSGGASSVRRGAAGAVAGGGKGKARAGRPAAARQRRAEPEPEPEEGEGFFMDLDDDGDGEMTDEKVNEMLAYFKQQRAQEEQQRAARGRPN